MADINEIVLSTRTVLEWGEYFSTLTRAEFHTLLRSVLECRKGLSIQLCAALAKKLYEDAQFSDGLDEKDRQAYSDLAGEIMGHAGKQADDKMRADLTRAWAATKDYAERFGYRSGAIYEALAPHQIFAE
jgi:hypothetical protein